MNRKLVTGTGLIIALALFLTVNIIANQSLTSLRLDLTEHNLYTLSSGSKNIVRGQPPLRLVSMACVL